MAGICSAHQGYEKDCHNCNATLCGYPIVFTATPPAGGWLKDIVLCDLSKINWITWAEASKALNKHSADIPADEPKPFPNWQPVKCSDPYCGWYGPAAKSVRWGEDDPKQYCPKCWNRVVKHESTGGDPP